MPVSITTKCGHMLDFMWTELQGIVEESARVLGAPIILEDIRFNLVAYGSQPADVDTVRQDSIMQRRSTVAIRIWFEQFGIATSAVPVATPADPAQGIAARLCVPTRWRGVTYGYLWAYGCNQTTGPEVARVIDLAEHAGIYLAQQSRQRERSASTLADLLSTDPDDVEGAALAMDEAGLIRRGSPFVAVVAGTADEAGGLSLNLWRLPSTVLASTDESSDRIGPGEPGTTLLVPLASGSTPAPLAAARDVAQQTLELYAERLPPDRHSLLVAGIGAPRTDLREARASWREARIALRVAAAVPTHQPVATWAELGIYRLLAARPDPALLVDASVLALLNEPELARTALIFLDLAGNVAATAATLAVHRQTLYYRLARIETLTGMSWRDGTDRLQLHAALTLGPLLD